jgi:hypothetical protein
VALEAHPGAEEHPRDIGGRPVDDRHAFQAPAQEAHPAVDFAQTALAVGVLGVFRAVALRGSLLHGLRDARTFRAPQFVQLGAQARSALGCDEL